MMHQCITSCQCISALILQIFFDRSESQPDFKAESTSMVSQPKASRLVQMATLLGVSMIFRVALAANELECFETPGTMQNICVEPGAVRVNGDVRSSPVYMGGPKTVKATSFVLVTNCKSSVSTLQDRDGSNFAGGRSGDTPALRSLAISVCSVPKPKFDRALRQF
jgi:hypothetical protein